VVRETNKCDKHRKLRVENRKNEKHYWKYSSRRWKRAGTPVGKISTPILGDRTNQSTPWACRKEEGELPWSEGVFLNHEVKRGVTER